MTFSDTTETRYDEMLGVVPPRIMGEHGFLVGKPMTHRPCRITGHMAPTYNAYFHRGDVYRVADEDMTVKEFLAITADEVFGQKASQS